MDRSWRGPLHEIIFEADTGAGKAFDVALLVCIVLSVLAVTLESVAEVREVYGLPLRVAEWVFTLLFTVEYVLRILAVKRPIRYIVSFFGVVDLLSILPTYLSLLAIGTQSLLVIRSLRLLRVFRVLKLGHLVHESKALMAALKASVPKITVFLGAVATLVVILGTLMYLVEGERHGFTSIPKGIYWAVVTVTTVGYGDIAPQTTGGQAIAALTMILGYSVIAVPTGIVSVSLANVDHRIVSTQSCPACGLQGHDDDAHCCKYCGHAL